MNSKFVCIVVAALAVTAMPLPAHAQDSSTGALVGHWRKTTVSYGEPRDEHLVLRPNGAAERWVVTAKNRSPVTAGQWRSEGKILAVQMQGQNVVALPFTFHQGSCFPTSRTAADSGKKSAGERLQRKKERGLRRGVAGGRGCRRSPARAKRRGSSQEPPDHD